MNILLLTDGIYPCVIGGMQKHSYYLAKYLAKNKIKVDLFHCVYQGQIPDHQGADPHYFSEEELSNIHFSCFSFPKSDRWPGHYLRENKIYSSLIYEAVKDRIKQYDLIYAQGYTGWRFIKERKGGNLAVPVLVNFHGLEMFQKAPSLLIKLQHLLLRPLTRWSILHADFVSSFGGKITEILEKLGTPASKIIEIPIGIEASWLGQEHNKEIGSTRKFVFIGRYERRKGLQELNTVLKQLLEEGIGDFEFHFIGPIPEDKRILADKIVYHGEIWDQHDIQHILLKSDILVCPSYSEGMPTVILEAMAKGLAIIATKVGAVEKEVQGNGWLMERVRTECLKNTLINAIHISPDQLAAYQKRSVFLIKENFLWDKVVALTIEAFQKIIIR